MQIRKTYQNVKPELLYDEVRDFVLKQGVAVAEAKFETYSLPDDSSSFISRGILTFKAQDESGKTGRECLNTDDRLPDVPPRYPLGVVLLESKLVILYGI